MVPFDRLVGTAFKSFAKFAVDETEAAIRLGSVLAPFLARLARRNDCNVTRHGDNVPSAIDTNEVDGPHRILLRGNIEAACKTLRLEFLTKAVATFRACARRARVDGQRAVEEFVVCMCTWLAQVLGIGKCADRWITAFVGMISLNVQVRAHDCIVEQVHLLSGIFDNICGVFLLRRVV